MFSTVKLNACFFFFFCLQFTPGHQGGRGGHSFGRGGEETEASHEGQKEKSLGRGKKKKNSA